jgi:PKD repeat protein
VVQFENLSAGDFDACLWEFGDGETSDQCIGPTHEYAAAGVYTVTLMVSGLGGTDTLVRPNLITVYEPVTADFSGAPTAGIAPLLVTFDNQSVGDYNLCFWAFGDGATSMDCASPQHAYAAGGVYTVTLEVVGQGGSDLEVKPGYITVYEPVTAAFSAEPTAGLAPLPVAFTNRSTGDFDSCLWDFGDGGTSAACGVAKHLYVAPGLYTVTLTVSGPGGTDSLVREGYITVAAVSYAIFIPVAQRPE